MKEKGYVIRIKEKTRKQISAFGEFGDTYDDVITKLIMMSKTLSPQQRKNIISSLKKLGTENKESSTKKVKVTPEQ